MDGEPVPGTFAAEEELFGLGRRAMTAGPAVFELAPQGAAGEDIVAPKKEVDWMRRLAAKIDRPVSFALIQVDADPKLWRGLMAASLDAVDDGADLWPQVAGRATGLLSGLETTYCLLDVVPAFQELKAKGLAHGELLAALRTDSVRRAILEWVPDAETADRLDQAYASTYLLGDPPDYEPAPDCSLAARAEAAHRHPLEMAYDALVAGDGKGLFYVPILNYSDGDLEPAREMLLHPRSVCGLGDGGAHCGVICDASIPTFMLTHWTRDRRRGDTMPLELVVKKQSHDTARLYGLEDRGTIEVGMLADLNLIDYDMLQLEPPRVTYDLPAGGSRLVQQARGYVATIKSGVTTFEHGIETGRRPGRLVRGGVAASVGT